MIPPYLTDEELAFLINKAFEEDLGEGDFSSLATIQLDQTAQVVVVAKGTGVIAGIELASYIARQMDSGINVYSGCNDGEYINVGMEILELKGPALSILALERTLLNFMQRMSGIATQTRKLVRLLDGTQTKLLDTRKTCPMLRKIEKWAVLIGGGVNHRMGLYDMIMLKDNHIDFAGGITNAIRLAGDYLKTSGKDLKIEIETRNLGEVQEVIRTGGIDMIMLDNMSLDEIKEAVIMINGKYRTEVSGNVTENNIRAIAECGVDYISSGMITHSAPSMDLSMKAKK